MRDSIVAELDDLAAHLAPPDPDVDVAGAALAEIRIGRHAVETRTGRRWPRWAAVAAIVVVAASASIPATREAVADLLGFGGVEVRQTGGGPDGLGTTLDLGAEVELDEAADRAPAPLAAPAGIGPPAAAFAGRPVGGVTLAWAPSAELPEVLDTGVGLLLTTFPGQLDEGLIEKRLLEGSTIESTTVDGAPAWWISGAPHAFLYLDENGNPREDTARLSDNVLLWERDGVTHRLESSLSLSTARRLAESLEPI